MSEARKGVVKFGTDGWRGIIADDFHAMRMFACCGVKAHCPLCAAARGRCGKGVCHGV